jgi:hypothetical protein
LAGSKPIIATPAGANLSARFKGMEKTTSVKTEIGFLRGADSPQTRPSLANATLSIRYELVLSLNLALQLNKGEVQASTG